jgi:hypothetical protein
MLKLQGQAVNSEVHVAQECFLHIETCLAAPVLARFA